MRTGLSPIRFDRRMRTDVPAAPRFTVVRTCWSGTEAEMVGTACHTGSQRLGSGRSGAPQAPQTRSSARTMITLTDEVCAIVLGHVTRLEEHDEQRHQQRGPAPH